LANRRKASSGKPGRRPNGSPSPAHQDAEESTARAKQEVEDVVANAKAGAAEILVSSKAEAEATVAQAQHEAAEHLQRSQEEVVALREEAEARMSELHADTEAIQQERSQLLDDIREITTRVEEAASAADARFPPPRAAEQAEQGNLQSGTAGEADATEVTENDMPTAEAGVRRRSPQ
jgi:cell division septum initiation protein DivIVA